MDELEEIQKILKTHQSFYIEIPYKIIHPIYELLYNHILDETIIDDVYYLYCGWYFMNIPKNLDTALEYYQKSSGMGNHHGMHGLAICYYNKEEYQTVLNYCQQRLDMYWAHNLIGCYYNKEHNYIKAYESYKQCLRLSGLTSPIIITNTIRCAIQLNNVEDFAKFLAEECNHPEYCPLK
jgi:tetratricopeptide (TPR) repeat protein